MTLLGVSVRVVERDVAVCRVQVCGEVDLATVGTLEFELTAILDLLTPAARVVLDASGVGFLSAGGVRVLVGFGERLRSNGGDLVIEPVSPAVDQVLRVCGYAGMLGVPHR